MGVFKKVLLFCFFLNCSFFFGQDKVALSQLSYEAISDSINKYVFTNLPKSLEAAEAYILKAQKEKNKKKEWEGISAICFVYISSIENIKAQ